VFCWGVILVLVVDGRWRRRGRERESEVTEQTGFWYRGWNYGNDCGTGLSSKAERR